MTDNEIIKALEDFLKNFDGKAVDFMTISFALDLINRQKAEIERLQKENNQFADIGKMYSEIKAEAVKEFAERYERYLLSQLTTAPLDKKEWINFCLDELDNLKKEMVGEGNV